MVLLGYCSSRYGFGGSVASYNVWNPSIVFEPWEGVGVGKYPRVCGLLERLVLG